MKPTKPTPAKPTKHSTYRKPPAKRTPAKRTHDPIANTADALARQFARNPGDRCPYMFPEHQSHAAQQCTRLSGHLGHHHCAGLKK